MARTSRDDQDQEILRAALEGLEVQRSRIEEQIALVRQRMGQRTPRKAAAAKTSKSTATKEKPARKKRVLSAAARKRIAAAQKARWAAYRKEQDGGEG